MAETSRHRLAFGLYWEMGPERSIERLHAALAASGKAPTLRTLYEWSRRFHWQNRIARLEREARRAEDEARIEALREMHERQAKEGLLLQRKGTEWLAGMADTHATADAAIRALVEGARLERLARGEPTERQEVRTDVEINTRLAALTDDELDRVIEYAEGVLGGEGSAQSS